MSSVNSLPPYQVLSLTKHVDLLGRTSHCSAWHMIIQYLGDNCIPIFHLEQYHDLRLRSCGAVTYPMIYLEAPNQKFEYGYPYAVFVKLERGKPHKVARHLAICDVINDAKVFPTDIRTLLTLSNQTFCVSKSSALELQLLCSGIA